MANYPLTQVQTLVAAFLAFALHLSNPVVALCARCIEHGFFYIVFADIFITDH